MCIFASSNSFFDRDPDIVFLSFDAMMKSKYDMIISYDL
jgi:hypothetical protein